MSFEIEKYHFKTDSLFDILPEKELGLFKKNIILKEEKKGKLIFEAGVHSKGLYILKKGKIKIYQINKDAKEQIIHIYRKGETFGYRPLLCNEPHPVNAKALEDCLIYFIPSDTFLNVLAYSSELANYLLLNLSHEFNVLINKIAVFAQQPVLPRVALALLVLHETYTPATKNKAHTAINLSREDLANYVGTTIETLVRTLRHFKDKKIIQSEGRKIIILKPKELEKMAELISSS